MLVTWNNFLTAIYSFHGNKHNFYLTFIYPGRIQNSDISISFRRMFKWKIWEYYVKLNLGNERNGTLYHNSKIHFITNVFISKTIWITKFFLPFKLLMVLLIFVVLQCRVKRESSSSPSPPPKKRKKKKCAHRRSRWEEAGPPAFNVDR